MNLCQEPREHLYRHNITAVRHSTAGTTSCCFPVAGSGRCASSQPTWLLQQAGLPAKSANLNCRLQSVQWQHGSFSGYSATELWMAVHQRTCRHISPVSLMYHSGRDTGRLPPTNLQYHHSTSLSSASGLFRRFSARASGTVFHHTWPLHHCLRYSDSVLKDFSFTCHIRTWLADLLTAVFNCGPCNYCC